MGERTVQGEKSNNNFIAMMKKINSLMFWLQITTVHETKAEKEQTN
jgi:hypothetical protein